MATKKLPGWLVGCGIGCGVLLLGLAVLVGWGAMWTRGTMQGFNSAVEARDLMEERLGGPDAFTPPPDGSIPPARVEAFLAVREATQPARKNIEAVFEKLPLSAEQARELDEKPLLEKVTQILGIVGSATGMAGEMGTFLSERNRALLAADMGLGEYVYIYSLAYYSLLHHPPGDGPGDQVRHEDARLREESVQVMGTRATSRTRAHLTAILANQLAAFPEDAPPGMRDALEAEIGAMEQDPDRLPWQESLPEAIAASLEPYRDRLESTYSPLTNAFELARVQKKNAVSFTAD